MRLCNAVFDENVGENGRDRYVLNYRVFFYYNCCFRLKSLILSSRAKHLFLDIACDPPLIDEKFLRDFSRAVQYTGLQNYSKGTEASLLYLSQKISQNSPSRLNKNALFQSDLSIVDPQFLSDFDVLEMPRLIVDSDLLLPVILVRFFCVFFAVKWSLLSVISFTNVILAFKILYFLVIYFAETIAPQGDRSLEVPTCTRDRLGRSRCSFGGLDRFMGEKINNG